MKAFLEARKRFIGFGLIIVLVLLMMNLNSRLSEYFHLTSERDKLATQVGYLSLTRVALDTQVAYATSDQAVEDWARNEAHMSKAGDKVIFRLRQRTSPSSSRQPQRPRLAQSKVGRSGGRCSSAN